MKEKPGWRVIKEHIAGSIGAVLFLTFILFLLGGGRGESIGITLGTAVLSAFAFLVEFILNPAASDVVVENESMDRVVVAQIIKTTTESTYYLGQVTRNYADGVFKREEEFSSLDKAQIWLAVVYEEELTKHLLKVGIQDKEVK